MIKFDICLLQPNISQKAVKNANVTVPVTMREQRTNVFSSISFKGQQAQNNFVVEQAKQSKSALNHAISEIMKKDRIIFSDSFYGEVSDENKFSKAGWYYILKNNEDSSASRVVKNLNLRQYTELYNNFYNSNLVSAYYVAKGKRKYLSDDLNREIVKEYNENGNLDNYFETRLDNYFETFEQNRNQVLGGASAEVNKQFVNTIKPNPLLMTPKNITYFMDIVDKMILDSDLNTVNDIYNNLEKLSSALHYKDKLLMLSSFDAIAQKVVPYWEANILAPKVSEHEKNQNIINEFVKSPDYQILNNAKKMDLLFIFSDFSEEEKVFLINKLKKDKFKNQSHTIALFDFLNNTVPSLPKKKRIIQNIMEKEMIAGENFDLMKQVFISDIRNKNENSSVLTKKIGGISLIDRVNSQLPYEDDYAINRLDKLTDEDLNNLLDTLKPLWIDEKYKESCNLEAMKYDIADNFDSLNKQLTVDIDGNRVPLAEFLQSAFNNLEDKNLGLEKMSLSTLKKVAENQSLIIQNGAVSNAQYTYMMQQMLAIVEILSAQNKDSELMHAQISKVLDKLEIMCPDNHRDIVYVRSTFEKIKDGLFNKQNLITGMFTTNMAVKAGSVFAAKGAAALCDPTGITLSILTLLYAGTILNNVRKEFKKS